MKRQTGTYETLSSFRHFIPFPLPPKNPGLELEGKLALAYANAMHKIGQLNEIASRLPSTERFIKAYVIKEALQTSAIEGINTTLLDVFTQPLTAAKRSKETQLVLNYTYALDRALETMNQGTPLSSRVIKIAHEALMGGAAGSSNPGNYRQQSVRVGNLIPPPAHMIAQLIADLEAYIHAPGGLPPLIKAGLVHVQFETIHPFLDGNGRIGRLLIVLMLMEYGVLSSPIMYLSYYFKKNHAEYYRSLNAVETEGDFERWILLYLTALEATCHDAIKRIDALERLEREITEQCETDFERVVINQLFKTPVVSVSSLATAMGKSYNTAKTVIQKLSSRGVITEITAYKRNKLYQFSRYLYLLEVEL